MEPKRPISRRSFMQRVGGGVVVAGSATMLTGCAGLVDADPYDQIGSRGGYGRHHRGRGYYPPRECTDSDSGRYADPRGRGRRCAVSQGCTDSDRGGYADPPGGGRCR